MSLPNDFLWGFSTAAYQIEGATNRDGRGPSIWDTFCAIDGKIADGSSGIVACESYKRPTEDIALLKSLGATAYRFSISWSRIVPLGGRNDPVNQKGVDHYTKFIDDLLDAGITPFITLVHLDPPDGLEKRYGGLLNKEEFPRDFENYARIMFRAIPKCKHWITFNEPWCASIYGYNSGLFAPGRTSDRSKSAVGDSAREPWIVGHNIILAHALAVKAYREDFKPNQGGEIGITLSGDATYPWDSEDNKDIEACDRKLEFTIAWFADPIYFGEYPVSMRKQLGNRLPTFTPEEAALVKGSNDFYGMNHYTANYIKHKVGSPSDDDFLGNVEALFSSKSGECIGPPTQSAWLHPNPQGFRDLLNWLSERYEYPKIYVTENGTSLKGENQMRLEQVIEDDFRVKYFEDYVKTMAKAAVEDGINVKAYLAWSLLDNFEWAEGYETRFGLCFVDHENDQKRCPKKSAKSLKPLFDTLIKKE
ncbi:glycoside hydrolase family 1 protein [Dactylonectria estremocensis]|uniref:beta-glucosidase n=1 Tax=Dactylonectria estremocensis TaxID=1079267 RepID=A0A9P9DCC6_9HYPO|nr:glycoside hydrolase family 1 protein [Dactylonectria estremocensis]